MAKLTETIMNDFENARPWAFATSSAQGEPNVCLIGIGKLVDSETIWLVDNYMNKTMANIRENPRGSLLVHSADTEGSWQIKGDLELVSEGPDYEEARKMTKERNEKLPARTLVVFRVTEAYNVKSGDEAGAKVL